MNGGERKIEAVALGTLDHRAGHDQVPLYNISITFDELSADKANEIVRTAKSMPSYPMIDLDTLLLAFADDLLPSPLGPTLKASCECHDFKFLGVSYYGGVPRQAPFEPCKHLAALMDKLAACVDQDASMIFTLRGVDLWPLRTPPRKRPRTRPRTRPRMGIAFAPIDLDVCVECIDL